MPPVSTLFSDLSSQELFQRAITLLSPARGLESDRRIRRWNSVWIPDRRNWKSCLSRCFPFLTTAVGNGDPSLRRSVNHENRFLFFLVVRVSRRRERVLTFSRLRDPATRLSISADDRDRYEKKCRTYLVDAPWICRVLMFLNRG